MSRRKCYCNKCRICLEHARYLKEKNLRLHRSRIQNINNRHKLEDANVLLDDFIAKRISLSDLEVELNVK